MNLNNNSILPNELKENVEVQMDMQNDSMEIRMCDLCLGNFVKHKCGKCDTYLCNECVHIHRINDNNKSNSVKGTGITASYGSLFQL